jgi:phage I-like protein
MNATILNREFQHPADGWYQIEPLGRHPNAEAHVIQVIDGEACAAIVNRFNADAAAGLLRHGSELLVDHEHFSADPDQESRAYGWLTRLQNRADGVYGQIRWTKTGKEAVDGGDYRFFSTEYDPKDCKVLNDGKVRELRPLRLDGLSLTNMNNNRGQKPITNRAGDEQFRRGVAAGADNEQTKKGPKRMKSVATKLGLSADASEEAVLAEVTKITNRATEAEAKVLPLTQRVTALESENATLASEQIESDLAGHGIKDEKIINRVKPVLAAMKNRTERQAFLNECFPKAAVAAKGQTKLNNRDTKPPTAGATEDASKGREEQAKATKIMNRANELQKQMPKMTLATAVTMAKAEIEAE